MFIFTLSLMHLLCYFTMFLPTNPLFVLQMVDKESTHQILFIYLFHIQSNEYGLNIFLTNKMITEMLENKLVKRVVWLF